MEYLTGYVIGTDLTAIYKCLREYDPLMRMSSLEHYVEHSVIFQVYGVDRRFVLHYSEEGCPIHPYHSNDFIGYSLETEAEVIFDSLFPAKLEDHEEWADKMDDQAFALYDEYIYKRLGRDLGEREVTEDEN